jgi:hypothetical protein
MDKSLLSFGISSGKGEEEEGPQFFFNSGHRGGRGCRGYA